VVAQERHRTLPHQVGLVVVGTRQVLVGEEGMARRVEGELRLDARLGLDPLGRPACGVGRVKESSSPKWGGKSTAPARSRAAPSTGRSVMSLPASSLLCVVAAP